MRLRKVAGALDALKEDKKYFIENPADFKGKWKNAFSNDNKLAVEIGCGKGDFAIGMAKAFPDINFIAIEKFESVLIRADEKALKEDIPNLRFVHFDAANLKEIFNDKEIDIIYLNFSDPWPKTRHAKRRLTAPSFLDVYKDVLKDDGVICQKTDNQILFNYSIESFSQNDWYLSNISVDLHSEDRFNIMTEYETKKSKLGPIYRLEARRYKN